MSVHLCLYIRKYYRWDDTPTSRFDTITILGCQYDMYCDFFKNFNSTSIVIRYCYVLQFLFLTLYHGKKLNDTLNIQPATIIIKKTHSLAVTIAIKYLKYLK